MGNGTVVLLGAGASRESGIPLTRELTERVIEDAGDRKKRSATESEEQRLRRQSGQETYEVGGQQFRYTGAARAVSAVEYTDPLALIYGRLFEQEVRSGTSPAQVSIDLEEVVTVADMLAVRRNSHLSAMVREWDPDVLELDHESVGWIVGVEPVTYGLALAEFVEKAVIGRFREGRGSAFATARRRVEEVLPDHLVIDPDRGVGHLHPLLAADPPVDGIASLNYDLTVERAAQEVGVPVSTGVDEWDSTLELRFDPEALKLLKLHGTIDRTSPHHKLVLGGLNKLTARGPYLALLVHFGEMLRSASRLVVIGYSFRDEHINSVVEAHLRLCESTARPFELVVVGPDFHGTCVVTDRQNPGGPEWLTSDRDPIYWPGGMHPTKSKRTQYARLRAVERTAGDALADGVLAPDFAGGILAAPPPDKES